MRIALARRLAHLADGLEIALMQVHPGPLRHRGESDAQQAVAAREVVKKGLSVRETEALVRRLLNPPKRRSRTVDPDILRLQDDLAETLCARVRIQHGPKGKGKLVIAYNSADELEGIIGHLKK